MRWPIHGCAFACTHNDRQLLRTDGSGALLDVVTALYGLDIADGMLPLPALADDATRPVAVTGLHRRPCRAARQSQRHCAIRQPIAGFRTNRCPIAIREAYRTLLPQGRFPVAIISIVVPPEQVDVNIHPTKREVRFREPRVVFAAVQRAVRVYAHGAASGAHYDRAVA